MGKLAEAVRSHAIAIRNTCTDLVASCSPARNTAISAADELCQTYILNTTQQVLLVKMQAELYRAADQHAPRHEFHDAIDACRSEFIASDTELLEQIIDSADKAASGKFVSSAIGLISGTLSAIWNGQKAKQDLLDELERREEAAFTEKNKQISRRLGVLGDLRAKAGTEYLTFITAYTDVAAKGGTTCALPVNRPNNHASDAEQQEQAYAACVREQTGKALTNAKEAYQMLQIQLDKLKVSITEQTKELKKQQANARQDPAYALARDLFALFLIRRPGTATHAYFNWGTKRDHAERANDLAIELNNSHGIPRANFGGNDVDVRALTAKLKRVSASDMDSQSDAYVASQYRLVKALHLLVKAGQETPANTTRLPLKEKLSFYCDLLFNKVDQQAHLLHSETILADRTNCCFQCTYNHGLTSYRYGEDIEKDMRDYLQRLHSQIEHSHEPGMPEPEVSAAELTQRLNTIVSFYYNSFVNEMKLFARDQLQANPDHPETQRLIHERAMKMVNRELSDQTPSNYYHAPMAGIALFLDGYAGKARITVQYDHETRGLSIDYLGERLAKLQAVNDSKSVVHTTRHLTIPTVSIDRSRDAARSTPGAGAGGGASSVSVRMM